MYLEKEIFLHPPLIPFPENWGAGGSPGMGLPNKGSDVTFLLLCWHITGTPRSSAAKKSQFHNNLINVGEIRSKELLWLHKRDGRGETMYSSVF